VEEGGEESGEAGGEWGTVAWRVLIAPSRRWRVGEEGGHKPTGTGKGKMRSWSAAHLLIAFFGSISMPFSKL